MFGLKNSLIEWALNKYLGEFLVFEQSVDLSLMGG